MTGLLRGQQQGNSSSSNAGLADKGQNDPAAICATPSMKGANKGKPATGTYGGWQRHRRAGEPACPPCLDGYNRHQRTKNAAKRKATAQKKPTRKPDLITYGGQAVRCDGCGERGIANKAIVGRARTIHECRNCRTAA